MPAVADRLRTRRVEHCMGTVFTIDVRDPGDWDAVMAEVIGWLHHVDEVFSTYRPGSDVNRLRRRELALADSDPSVAEVLDLCARAQRATGGYFTARWSGGLDPTGLVKGWAIERASSLLTAAGSRNHAVNGGGDMQLAGEGAPGMPWRVGIADPCEPGAVLATVSIRDGAVATSGTAERGHHVIDPFTGRPVTSTRSVTVVGASLTWVDAYATAALAMGPAAADWLEKLPGHEGLVIAVDGKTRHTAGWPRLTRGGSAVRSRG